MRKQHTKFEIQNIFMIKRLNINKIDKYFHGWRVADARVVGGKNTHNGMGRLLLTSNTNKGTNALNALSGRAGLTQILQSNRNAPCYTCSNTGIERSYMNDFVKHTNYFADRYRNTTNFSAVIGGQGMKSANFNQVNATAHMIRFIYDDGQLTNPTFVPTAFEGYYTNPNPFPNCRVDAQIGIDPNKVVCEFKSWGTRAYETDETVIDDPGKYTTAISQFENFAFGYSSFGQFRCYLQQISAMDKLRYYFDEKRAGVTETYVEGIFQKLIYNETTKQLTPNGELVFDAIWGNTRGLKVDLFGGQTVDIVAKKIFIDDYVSKINSRFYSFINVK